MQNGDNSRMGMNTLREKSLRETNYSCGKFMKRAHKTISMGMMKKSPVGICENETDLPTEDDQNLSLSDQSLSLFLDENADI